MPKRLLPVGCDVGGTGQLPSAGGQRRWGHTETAIPAYQTEGGQPHRKELLNSTSFFF